MSQALSAEAFKRKRIMNGLLFVFCFLTVSQILSGFGSCYGCSVWSEPNNVCIWLSLFVFGLDMFCCMTTPPCDFSQGQDEVMPALVSFRKPTASVWWGVTRSYRICQPFPFINGTCLFLCHRHLYFWFDSQMLHYAIRWEWCAFQFYTCHFNKGLKRQLLSPVNVD